MNHSPIIIERTLNASVENIWRALTTKEEMKHWYFDLAEFRLEIGFEFQFTGGPPEKQYLHLCTVTEVIVEKKLTYSWRYDGYGGISYVTFELFAEEKATKIVLTHSGLESFPQDIPDFAVKNFVEGWTDLIGRSLKEYIE